MPCHSRRRKRMKPTTIRRERETYQFAVKKGGKFRPMPHYSEKQQRDIMLERGKYKKLPALYVVKKKGGRIVASERVG